jgi:hypothetical protein
MALTEPQVVEQVHASLKQRSIESVGEVYKQVKSAASR